MKKKLAIAADLAQQERELVAAFRAMTTQDRAWLLAMSTCCTRKREERQPAEMILGVLYVSDSAGGGA